MINVAKITTQLLHDAKRMNSEMGPALATSHINCVVVNGRVTARLIKGRWMRCAYRRKP